MKPKVPPGKPVGSVVLPRNSTGSPGGSLGFSIEIAFVHLHPVFHIRTDRVACQISERADIGTRLPQAIDLCLDNQFGEFAPNEFLCHVHQGYGNIARCVSGMNRNRKMDMVWDKGDLIDQELLRTRPPALGQLSCCYVREYAAPEKSCEYKMVSQNGMSMASH